MKKKLLILFCGIMTAGLMLSGCATKESAEKWTGKDLTSADESAEAEDLFTIVYTNDIHSYIANEIEAEDGSDEDPEDGLRLSKVAKMVKDMRADGEEVLLVDAGDEIQGCTYGSIDYGESVIELMNAAGYQLATPGNHEFDYGMLQFFNIVDKAAFPYISCNFHYTEGEDPLEGTKIMEAGEVKIAFIGITTPETITTSTPVYFQDEKGNYIYQIDGTDHAQALYDSVQAAIDSVKDDADYVIALGHVGVGADEKKKGITSEDVIANTTGLDAFIDGHSHTVMEGEEVKDKDGEDVLLTQTGCYLENVGVMTVKSDGSISTELRSDYDSEDETVAALESQLITTVKDELGQKVATLDSTLYISEPEKPDQRLIRAQEMNAGDFLADGIYWYFNESAKQDCDLALENGGNVRAALRAGDITGENIKDIQPFGDMICLIKATGQQILDALEMGATVTGEWDEEWDRPSENGGFLQVAGLKYTIDPSIASSVKTDDEGMFVSVDGDYRVKDVQVYNKETKAYEPLDLNKEYTVGGVDYIMRDSGNGLSMFKDCETVVDYVGQDCDILTAYMKSFTAGEDGYAKINTANSPLIGYSGYLLNYENAYGAGRITILQTADGAAADAQTQEAEVSE